MFPAGHTALLVLSLGLVTSSYGQRDQLTSQFVSSCGSNGLDVTNFGITYHRDNRLLEYRFIGAAQGPGLSADIHIDVTAYGIKAPTQIIDLCAVATCPLSQSGINVEGSQTLDASYADKLPAIAWTIPDLDAIATFTFWDGTTQLACLEASLSNGVTTQTTSVPWVTGITTIVAIAAAGVISAAGTFGLATTGTGTVSGHHVLPPTAPSSSTPGAPSSLTPGAPSSLTPGAPSSLTPGAPSSLTPGAPSPLTPGAPSPLTPGAPSSLTTGAPSSLTATALSPMSTASAPGGNVTFGLAIPVAMAAGASTLPTIAGTTSGSAAQPHATTQAQPQPFSGDHGPLAGRMDPIVLFLHFQSISSTGLLSLRYPPIYQAFTVNFAWANFIIPIGAFKNAVTHLRKCNLPDGQPAANGNGIASLAVPSVSSSPLTQQMGIQAYATRIGVPAQDVFGIVYLVYLSAFAVLIALFFFIGLAMHVGVLIARTPERRVTWMARRARWKEMASNNTLRIMTLALGTLATFSFYQWTQDCTSRLVTFLSASALIIILANLGIVTFLILRLASRPGGSAQLFSKDTSYGRRWGSLYDTLNESTVYFVIPILVFVIARSAITAFGQGHGLAQVIALLSVEFIFAVGLFYWQPYYSKGYNRVNYLLEIGKFISHVFLLLFVPSFSINLIGTTVIGIVLLVINSVIALVLVVLTVLKLGWGIMWFRKKHHAFEIKDEKQKRLPTIESSESYDDGKVDDSSLARRQGLSI